jgi:hypothetical protein
VAAASGKENAEHDQGDPTHSVRRLKQASSAGLPGDGQRAFAGKMASRSSQLHRSGRSDIRTRACTSNSTPRAAVALWWKDDGLWELGTAAGLAAQLVRRRDGRDGLQLLADGVRQLVDEQRQPRIHTAAGLDQTPRGGRLAPGLRPIVDDEDAVAFGDHMTLQTQRRLQTAPVGWRLRDQLVVEG